MPDNPSVRPSKKGKDREPRELVNTADFAENFTGMVIAHQRRTAAPTRPKDRSERAQPKPVPSPAIRTEVASPRPPSSSPHRVAAPHVIIAEPTHEADPEEFSRRLKISSSPRSSPRPQQKLYNPDSDSIPMRYPADSELLVERAGNPFVPRQHIMPRPQHSPQRDTSHQRQLFDHRKDDPVRFSLATRPSPPTPANNTKPTPTPQSSADYVSASSTSSYAHSTISSNFTLSTDGSSASSALFDGKPHPESGANALSAQLKRLYRSISTMEAKVLQEDESESPDEPRVLLKGRDTKNEDAEKDRWKRILDDHKSLAEMMHNLLQLTLASNVPASLRNIPEKYNLILRLWRNGFYHPLENLRLCAFNNSTVALEHLQDFIYYAYTFYSCLYEEVNLTTYRINWIETLGDLARYRMAVSELVNSKISPSTSLTQAAVSQVPSSLDDVQMGCDLDISQSSQRRPAVNGKASNSPSVGIEAARSMELLPEKEKWRNTAREWYAKGLSENPGTGRLHHHMGFLCKEFGDEGELRGIYHFIKSMTTPHPFSTSRESILALWSPAAQTRRALPEAPTSDLFVLLHGMLFTNIQLDDFQPTLSRFLERLQIQGAEERDWIMMGIINTASIFEYGRSNAVMYQISGINSNAATQQKLRMIARKGEERKDVNGMDIDGDMDDTKMISNGTITQSPKMDEDAAEEELPVQLRLALQLTFALLAQTLKNPTRKSLLHGDTLNPYITIVLTFLSIVMKSEFSTIFERAVPWKELAQFLSLVPRTVLKLEAKSAKEPALLTTGCSPLPEDSCLRGMAWGGRKVYEHGFWNKSSDGTHSENEVLDRREVEDMVDGIIEDDEDGTAAGQAFANEQIGRWTRVFRAGVKIAKFVDGFGSVLEENGKRTWKVGGALATKVERWQEQERRERGEEELRRNQKRWDDSMEVDDDDIVNSPLASDDSDDEDENDSEAVKALKARRRHLLDLLASDRRAPVRMRPHQRKPRQIKKSPPKASGRFVAGYTALVIDTNIILSSLPNFISLVEALRWTVIVPLPAIMELDGLSSSSSSSLAATAKSALDYISSHLKSHTLSLKVQTSKGNYLSSLSVRTEQVDLHDHDSWDRNMDDLILRAAIWHDEHWLNRSSMLKSGEDPSRDTNGASKVVLLSLDRNLRVKARSKQLAAANEDDLAHILLTGT